MREPERTQAEVQRIKNRKRYVVNVEPMRVFKCAGSPYGTRDMRDAKGNTVPVVMNRAERRRFLALKLTHTERLARREESRDHVRFLLRKIIKNDRLLATRDERALDGISKLA